MRASSDFGLFGPDSMTWRIDREVAVLLGSGSRALLLQVAHPKVAAAVAEHSRYRSDPLGRLRDTLNAIYGFAFADTQRVHTIVDHINHLHTHVHGLTPDGEPYSALDSHLLLWVYSTLIDSSLLAYETLVAPLTESEREGYYAEFRRAGPVWGMLPAELPASVVELRAWMLGLIDSGEVHVTEQGRYVGRFILDPRVWWMPPPAAVLLRLLTVWLLPVPLRSGFGYDWGPGREQMMRILATTSRALVPHLPRLIRDLPIARSADRRVRALKSGGSMQARAGTQRRSGPAGRPGGATPVGSRYLRRGAQRGSNA